MKYSEGNIRKCLKKGLLNEEHIDRAVDNILRALLRMEPKIRKRPMSVVRSKEHRALALEAAEKGMVLLENNGVAASGKGCLGHRLRPPTPMWRTPEITVQPGV